MGDLGGSSGALPNFTCVRVFASECEGGLQACVRCPPSWTCFPALNSHQSLCPSCLIFCTSLGKGVDSRAAGSAKLAHRGATSGPELPICRCSGQGPELEPESKLCRAA